MTTTKKLAHRNIVIPILLAIIITFFGIVFDFLGIFTKTSELNQFGIIFLAPALYFTMLTSPFFGYALPIVSVLTALFSFAIWFFFIRSILIIYLKWKVLRKWKYIIYIVGICFLFILLYLFGIMLANARY